MQQGGSKGQGGLTLVAIAVGAMLALLALAPTSASAATIKANKTGDPIPNGCTASHCTLREAVIEANTNPGPDTIKLLVHREPYKLKRAGAGENLALTGDLDITDPVSILYPKSGRRATIDAKQLDRIFDIKTFTGSVILYRLVLTGGKVLGAANDGGAVSATSRLVIEDSVIHHNESGDLAGGVYANADLIIQTSVLRDNISDDDSGAFEGSGTRVEIRNTLIKNNKSREGSGGAAYVSAADVRIVDSRLIKNTAGAAAGAIDAQVGDGTVRVVRSTISKNRAKDGTGGGIKNFGDLIVRSSTISRNVANDDGGGIFNGGGTGIDVENSTISNNRAAGDGGGFYVNNGDTGKVRSSTITFNVAGAGAGPPAGSGGGFHNVASPLIIGNTIVANNTIGGTTRNDCSGSGGDSFTSTGHNLFSKLGPAGACAGTVASDLVEAVTKLAPLARNGGPTETVRLKNGSPAINKAKKLTSPSKDQRGRTRDNRPDIGAFER